MVATNFHGIMRSVYALFHSWIDHEDEYHKELIQLYSSKEDAQSVADKLSETSIDMSYFVEKMTVL